MSEPVPPPPPPVPPPPPLNVQPLGYAQAEGAGRPGILTAVGVISIVMSVLSFFGALGALFQAVWLQFMPGFMRSVAVATTMPATAPAAAPPPNPFSGFQWDIPMLVAAALNGLVLLALSILLVVAGIMVLRDTRAGRKLHLIWAWARIPAAVLGAFVYYQMMDTMMTSMQATMPTPAGGPAVNPTAVASIFGTVFDFLLSLAYPAAVLIVMNTKKVKAFYLGLGK